MSDPTLIADLVRAGVDPELVQRVADLYASASRLPTSADASADATTRRRERDREYQAKKRALARTSHDRRETASNATVGVSSADCLPTSADGALSPRKDLSDDVSIERKKVSKRVRARARQQLPEGWRPDDLGADDHREFAEFDKFCDHARANGRLCADWTAAWRNWKRRAPDFAPKNGGQNGRSILTALDNVIEKFGGHEAARSYVPGSEGPQPLELDFGKGALGIRSLPKS